MSININAITSLGVSEKAAKLYIASVHVGTASLQTLASNAGIKRPTAYLHINELLGAGLIEKVPFGKRELFQPVSPKNLEQKAIENLEVIHKIIPKLESIQKQSGGSPSVRILQGRDGLERVYKEISNANSIRFWTDLAAFESAFQDAFIRLSTAIAQKEIRTREIITDTAEAKSSSRRYAAVAGKFYSSRISIEPGISNDSAIFGNVLALFRIQEYNLSVIRIEDAGIVGSVRALFDMAWGVSRRFIN